MEARTNARPVTVLLLALVVSSPATVVAKMEVPLNGALSASNPRPAADQTTVLYLNVTPQVDLEFLRLGVVLPEGVTAEDGSQLSRRFRDLRAGKTVLLAVTVRVSTAEPRRVIGTATIADTPSLKLEQAFVLDLNHRPEPEAKFEYGTDGRGNRVRLYESGK